MCRATIPTRVPVQIRCVRAELIKLKHAKIWRAGPLRRNPDGRFERSSPPRGEPPPMGSRFDRADEFRKGVAVVGADSSAEAPLTTSVANRGMIGAGAVPLKGVVLSRGTTMTGEDSAICPVLVWAGEVLERATRVFRAVTLLPNALGFVRSALVVRSRRADLHLIDPCQPRCIYIPVSGTCDPHRPVCYRI